MIDKLQEVGFSYDGIILNAAAYTHTSVGIGDAIKAIEKPVVEVHISNTLIEKSLGINLLYLQMLKELFLVLDCRVMNWRYKVFFNNFKLAN